MSEQAPEPGAYYEIAYSTYRAWDAINASLLQQVLKSPLHAWWYLTHGYDPTDAQKLGTAAHMAFLEPDKFDQTYVILPSDHDGRTTEGKARKAEIEESGKMYLKNSDARCCEEIRRVVGQESELHDSLQCQGQNELSVLWNHPSGEPCKARVDRVVPELGLAIDIKTTQSAKPEAFRKAIRKWQYDVQAGHYLDGLQANNLPIEQFWLVAVEKSPPHCITIFKFDVDALAYGRQRRDKAIEQLQTCRAMDYWPGYASEGVWIHAEDIDQGDDQ